MKKLIIVIIFSFLSIIQTFGHAYTITRNWCGGVFHRKFVAYARVSASSTTTYAGYNCLGQYIGNQTQLNWGTVCSNEDKGCTRPRIADCNKSGATSNQSISGCNVYLSGANLYNGHARAEHLTSGINLTQIAGPNTSAGLAGSYIVDAKKLEKLSKRGFGNSKINGNIELNEKNELVIKDLSGIVSIRNKSDFFSKIQILVIKERDDITESEAKRLESLYQAGNFENIVYSSELVVSKDKIVRTGIFKELQKNSTTLIEDKNSFGINIKNISTIKKIDAKLNKNEHLTVVALVDGGFDISDAIITKVQQKSDNQQQSEWNNESVKIFSIPSTGFISLKIDSDSDDLFTIYELGEDREIISTIYESKLKLGSNNLDNINFSKLKNEVSIIQFKIGNNVSEYKFSQKKAKVEKQN